MKRKKIKSSWVEYFNFSARERRGAFFLSFILIIQIAVLFYLKNSSRSFPPPDQKIISMLSTPIKAEVSDTIVHDNFPSSPEKNKISLKNFDPNQPDEKEWSGLGISLKQTGVVKNYLSHGGKFRVKNDFKKMYCFREDQYKTLAPYILLPDTIVNTVKEKNKIHEIIEPVDIQIADSFVFLNIRGIGPVFASRIVKYREKLGGFYSLEQLKEVWGVTDSIYQTLLPFLKLKDTIPFRFIHLNSDTFGILASHPYIKGKIAGLICSYRKQHKSFSSADDLGHLPLISEENFRKLAHYIHLD